MTSNFLQILILAVIQGATELLPVSSSAHVVLAEKLMGLDPGSPEMTFVLVMLHTGTMFAVLFYFWNRWKHLMGPSQPRFHFLKMIVVATTCTGILGLGLQLSIERLILEKLWGQPEGEVEHLFRSLPLITLSLFCVGALIIAAGTIDRSRDARAGRRPRPFDLNFLNSALIGIVQGLALPFRGFSRSGATISTALLCGIPQGLAQDFSFALAVVLTPPVIARELHRLLKASGSGLWQHPHGSGFISLVLPGVLGMVFSCVAGLLALRWLSSWLERGRWQYFGYYCIFAAALVAVGYSFGI